MKALKQLAALAPVYIVVMFIPEMLCSLEVDHIAAILLPCEDIGQGGFVPLAAVILVECLIFTGSPPAVFHVESGGLQQSYRYKFYVKIKNYFGN